MLEKLLIQNFQALTKFKVEFDEGLTVFVGSTDVGKSAVIRALRWLCLNTPQGNSFIRAGSKGTTVQLIVDGKKIGRKRGKSQNSYFLDDDEFKAFGQGVPDTIKDFLNVADINFQNQHDAPFWFSLSAGEVSRQLNSVVDLGIIDESLSTVSKKVRNLQQITQFNRQRVQNAKQKKESLDWIVEADKEYQRVEQLQQQTTRIAEERNDLQNTVQSTSDLQRVRERARQQLEQLNNVGRLAAKARSLHDRCRKLQELLQSVKALKGTLSRPLPDIEGLETCFQTYNEIRSKKQTLDQLVNDLKAEDLRLRQLKLESANARAELKEKTEGLCPICGNELK